MAMTGISQSASHIAETDNARAIVGWACSGSSSPSRRGWSLCLSPDEPCPPLLLKTSAPLAVPMKPMRAALRTINGNGMSKKKMPMNAAAASRRRALFFSARLPMRTTASTTIASTAAFNPKNRAATAGTLPYSA